MTTLQSPVMEPSLHTDPAATALPAAPDQAATPTLFTLLPASVLAYLWPRATRSWVHATFTRAGIVATLHTFAAFAWGYFILMLGALWIRRVPLPRDISPQPFEALRHAVAYHNAALYVAADLRSQLHYIGLLDRVALVGSVALIVLACYLVPYFVVLPFAARPGSNKACLRHVGRVVLLGSGLVHWWGVACAGAIVLMMIAGIPAPLNGLDYASSVGILLLLFALLVPWNLAVLILAVRREYRRPGDFPLPHDPWCDLCGYNLTGVDPAGRCPECGKPIAESIAPTVRPPTEWERRPSPLALGAIARQIAALIFHPRRLFFSMPTLSGQRAAQRWLFLSSAILYVAALPLVPAMYRLLDAEWNLVALTGALAMSVLWAVFGLMMVGIETAGIAAFSRMRGHPGGGVYLAASSKVTAYSSILMLTWILLGGIQLVAYVYFTQPGHDYRQLFHLSYRWEQIVLGTSLGIAHIGGLMWYELTVYRGVRGILYASK